MKLIFLSGTEKGSSRSLSPGEVKIGRETDNDIQLLVGGVSRYHAKISGVQKDGSRTISDLGSTNGTKVNGVAIESNVVLKDGDILLIGDQQLRVEEDVSPAAAPKVKFRPVTPSAEQNISVKENRKTFAVKTPEKSSAEKNNGEQKKEEVIFSNPDQSVLGDIFSDENSSYDSFGDEDSYRKEKKHKGKFSGLLFYVLLICAAVLSICLFLKLFVMPEGEKPLMAVQKKDPNRFFLSYEKEEITNTSIFRFEMLLECMKVRKEENKKIVYEDAAMVSYAVSEQKADDDIFYRIVQKPVQIELKDVEKLRKAIQDTEFMKLKEEDADTEAGRNEKNRTTRIIVGYNGNLNSVTVKNTVPKISFTTVQELIENFTDEVLEVRTVSMSVAEIWSQAEKYYLRAKEYYENYEAKPQNLRLAIRHYKLAVQLLSRFRPRPKMCIDAQRELERAEKIFNQKKKETLDDLKIKLKLNELPEALEKAKLLLEYAEPNTDGYEKIREAKMKIELQMQKVRNRKRRR